MPSYYPPVGFHFRVIFEGIGGTTSTDALFQEVSGLTMELEEETIIAGGENRFKFKVPKRGNYPDLVLKRGLLVDTGLIQWVTDAILSLEIQPVNILVQLLNEQGSPLQTYQVVNAWPKKWSVSDFNAEESRLVIETMDLAYQYFTLVGGAS
ncbi:MAG: phage tail protein [Bacteroidota bacterium]